MTPTTSQWQLRRREAGWGGSRRRNRDPRDTNRVEAGRSGRAGLARRSPLSSRGRHVDAAGVRGRLLVLSVEVSTGVLGMPDRRVCVDRRVGWDGGVCEGAARRGEVSRGRTTGGIDGRREGPNVKQRRRTPVLAGWALNAANPVRGLGGRVGG